jgi:polysaccharide deacetylase 2 family uncharacterized protein YibQ
MFRLRVIRRTKKESRLLLGADAIFVGLLVLALCAGGPAALAGAPGFLEALFPGLAAQAHGVIDLHDAPVPPPAATTGAAMTGAVTPLSHFAPVESRTDAVSRLPKIALVIDDLGEDIAATDRAMKLPPAVTLSFLPFAEATPWLAPESEKRGHEVLAHVPMQALGSIDPGPMALRVGLSAEQIAARLAWSLARVPGLVGINNHEGSRFTADARGLAPVDRILAARHLFFFDSRTIADSKVVRVAHRFGVASAARDVFLDDVVTPKAIEKQLARLETLARKQGVAIAIGHPHDPTLTVLANWKHAGFALIPLSEAIRLKSNGAVAVATAN